jgi:tetratricopeptide (TPR) repeat protein
MLWKRGNKSEALADYRKALDAQMLEPEFAIKIGDRLSQLVLWKEALQAYTRAYELAGGDWDRAGGKTAPLKKGASPYSMGPYSTAKTTIAPPVAAQPKGRVTLSEAGVTALIRRARVFDTLKDPKRALQDLTEAAERNPSSGLAFAAKGTIELRLGMDDAALADLNQAVKIEPKNPDVRVARGSFYARTERPKLAMDDFNAALAASPEHAESYNNRGALYANSFGDDKKAADDIEKAVALAPKDPNYLFNLAMLRLKSREYFKAIETFNASIRSQGPPAPVLAHRADAWSLLGDQTNALQDVQVALEKDPKYAPAYDILGLIRMRAHDYEQAIRDLTQALEIDEKYAPALLHRGESYGAAGSMKNALRDLNKAAALDPRSKEAFTILCQAERLSRKYGDAVRDCSRAIQLDTYYGPAYLQRGLTYVLMRQNQKAIEDIDNAAQLGVRRPEGLLAQSVAHAASRQYKDAHKCYERAVALNPAAHSIEIPFGIPRGDSDDYFNAMSDLEGQMHADQSQPFTYIVRADALRNAEHHDKAVIEYTKAMELDGTLAEAYVARTM